MRETPEKKNLRSLKGPTNEKIVWKQRLSRPFYALILRNKLY